MTVGEAMVHGPYGPICMEVRPAGRMLYRYHQNFLAGYSARSFDMSDVTLRS
jgi:hypothetical protein